MTYGGGVRKINLEREECFLSQLLFKDDALMIVELGLLVKEFQ